MAAPKKDPTEPIRLKASRYPGVDEGTSCTQNSYKTGKNAFLYIGMQGGRYKAMFKLQKSRPEAARLAQEEPDRYQVGSTAWVTARFTADKPVPRRLWEKWLDESFCPKSFYCREKLELIDEDHWQCPIHGGRPMLDGGGPYALGQLKAPSVPPKTIPSDAAALSSSHWCP